MKFKGLFASRIRSAEEARESSRKASVGPNNDERQAKSALAEAVAPELDELGLVPPPSNLPAPWAKPRPPVKTEQSNKSASAPGEDASGSKMRQAGPEGGLMASSKPAAESQSKHSTQQPASTLDTSIDYILDGAAMAPAADSRIFAGQPTLEDQSRAQTESSSAQSSDRSLIQASNAASLPPHIRMDQFLQREPSAAYTISDSDTGTPASSNGLYPSESRLSTGTVVVRGGHHTVKPSLTFTASIEDYAKKADPSTWEPPRFRKSQIVRIQPGIYPVPYKKLSESHSQYTKLNSYVKGTIHQIHKSTDSRDPREFVTDEGMVMYRVFVLRRLTTNVEFIFVLEEQMTAFNECTRCNAFASQRCSGCDKEYYCSEHCASADWKTHRHDCKHKGKTAPAFGPADPQETPSEGSAEQAGTQAKAVVAPVPRREFRTDGTVKIINGYKPDPNMLKGTTTILPLCLRPLTLEDELAPLPESRMSRMLRSASHRLRRRIYRNSRHAQVEEELSEIKEDQQSERQEPQDGESAVQPAGVGPVLKDEDGRGIVVEMTADGTFQGTAVTQQEDSLIGESLDDSSALTDRKDKSGLFGSNSPNSEKSAESLVEGLPPQLSYNHSLQAIMTQHSTASMPDLPRIRTKAQTPLQKAKSGISIASRLKKPPSKLSSAVSAGAVVKMPSLTGAKFAEPLPEISSTLALGSRTAESS